MNIHTAQLQVGVEDSCRETGELVIVQLPVVGDH